MKIFIVAMAITVFVLLVVDLICIWIYDKKLEQSAAEQVVKGERLLFICGLISGPLLAYISWPKVNKLNLTAAMSVLSLGGIYVTYMFFQYFHKKPWKRANIWGLLRELFSYSIVTLLMATFCLATYQVLTKKPASKVTTKQEAQQ